MSDWASGKGEASPATLAANGWRQLAQYGVPGAYGIPQAAHQMTASCPVEGSADMPYSLPPRGADRDRSGTGAPPYDDRPSPAFAGLPTFMVGPATGWQQWPNG